MYMYDPSRGGSRVGQNRSWGSLLQQISSSARNAAAVNFMHSNDLEACGMKCCYFWFHSEVKFLTRFDVFLDLIILTIFM